MRRFALLCLLLLLTAAVHAAGDWATPAEATHFRATPDYADTLAYLERLQAAAPEKIRLETFGTTSEGRRMAVVIASGDGSFTPAAAHTTGKAVVLVQAGIHAGEIEGKDAGLMLLRDFAITGKYPHLLDHVVLVFIPVFNVDGHEHASPYNRINQNGPASMGFRATAQYLNLNRDYIKADAPEIRAWLKLWQRWSPDFLVDVHTTDGADYQYDLTWYTEDADKLDPAVAAWQAQMTRSVMPAFDKRGHLASIYLEFKDGNDPAKGIENFSSGPRFSTGYAALQNRPGLLIETHMLKPYAVRVRAAYDLVELMLAHVNADPAALEKAVAKADADTIARAGDPHAQATLTYQLAAKSTHLTLRGYAWKLTHSAISNDNWIQYDRTKAVTLTIPNWNDLVPDIRITPPAAYAVPAQWTQVIRRLNLHGIRYTRTTQPITLDAAGYHLSDPVYAKRSFESHVMLKNFKQSPVTYHVTLPAGSAIVPLDQRAANVVIELLEPAAPDSLLHWGYLDAIFEPKEYGEPRVLEKLARDMLAKDPALRAEFKQRLHDDPAFAANSYARLDFFFRHSPWYSAQGVGAYPVLRLDSAALHKLEPALGVQ
ncbi:MAG TPA: M14 family metallopeptidase [Gammaproteobacteria bacterium]|nr:M14 family metallopeptidase [Gammaproteobacteria bacterium]